jgi:hypothetical protein
MSWRWTRDGQNLTSTCLLCHATITGRRDTDVTLAQRSHGWWECQQMRAITARAITPQESDDRPTHCRNGHEYTPETTRVDSDGVRHCQTCAQAKGARQTKARKRARAVLRGAETRCDITVLGVLVESEQGRIEGQRRTAQRAKRRTVLSTPDRYERQEGT